MAKQKRTAKRKPRRPKTAAGANPKAVRSSLKELAKCRELAMYAQGFGGSAAEAAEQRDRFTAAEVLELAGTASPSIQAMVVRLAMARVKSAPENAVEHRKRQNERNNQRRTVCLLALAKGVHAYLSSRGDFPRTGDLYKSMRLAKDAPAGDPLRDHLLDAVERTGESEEYLARCINSRLERNLAKGVLVAAGLEFRSQ